FLFFFFFFVLAVCLYIYSLGVLSRSRHQQAYRCFDSIFLPTDSWFPFISSSHTPPPDEPNIYTAHSVNSILIH
ncbi:hypothetical protein FN846DRAFT_951148, partial [Sphaerosporella brunnea]